MTRPRDRSRVAIGGLGAAILGIFLLAAAPPAFAADTNGKFAIKGAGIGRCAVFVAARAKRSERYSAFRGWFHGYLTAFNQLEANTYDVVAWQNPEVLAALLESHCKKNPEQPFYLAVAGLINKLKSDRVVARSPIIEAQHGDATVRLYRETMQRVQQALADRGYYADVIDGRFGPNTRLALVAFQLDEELKTTGLPDQVTLYRLLQ